MVLVFLYKKHFKNISKKRIEVNNKWIKGIFVMCGECGLDEKKRVNGLCIANDMNYRDDNVEKLCKCVQRNSKRCYISPILSFLKKY